MKQNLILIFPNIFTAQNRWSKQMVGHIKKNLLKSYILMELQSMDM